MLALCCILFAQLLDRLTYTSGNILCPNLLQVSFQINGANTEVDAAGPAWFLGAPPYVILSMVVSLLFMC